MSTIKAIEQCGRWSYKAGAKITENPFMLTTSYKSCMGIGLDGSGAERYSKKLQRCN